MAESSGAIELSREQFEEAAELLRALRETRWLVLALVHLAWACRRLGDERRGDRLNREALELALSGDDVRGAALVRSNIGSDLLAEGRDGPARILLEEALEGSRAAGDTAMIAACLSHLASLALRAGDLEAAAVDFRESLDSSPPLGTRTIWSRRSPLVQRRSSGLATRARAQSSAAQLRHLPARTVTCSSHPSGAPSTRRLRPHARSWGTPSNRPGLRVRSSNSRRQWRSRSVGWTHTVSAQ